ncbi:MAG: type I secretion C-terminal target domain-containing protein [Halioglobus sp.]|nr:type I secretion C-terminal target domain-containing protein [Halioglobus sp.]
MEGQPLVFTVTLSQASASPVTVDWQTALDSTGAHPASNSDFVGASGTVLFNPGETSKTVVVDTVADELNEFDETLRVVLDSPAGGVIATDTGIGTILDDDGPAAGTATATVDEDGLPAGIGDAADGDWTDTDLDGDGNEATTGGTLPADVGDKGPASFDFALMHGQTATLGAEEITYAWNAGSNTLTATTSSGERVGTDVFEVAVDPASGAYNVTLLAPAMHPAAGTEDDLTAALTYSVTDGSDATVNGTLNLVIDDDLPRVNGSDDAVEPLNFNLMVMLDVSSSMSAQTSIPDGQGGNLTRFEAAVESLNRLFDSYEQLGDVRVRLVTFSTSAAAAGGAWVTTEEARDLFDSLTPDGLTNYRAALEAASGIEGMSNGSFGNGAWNDPGRLADGLNVAYFASDGNPNIEGPLFGSRQNDWQNFLEDNEILSYSLGMGSGVNEERLDPIAYNGRDASNLDAITVTDFAQLGDTIVGTVPPVSGTLFDGAGAAGADGIASLAITIDGTIFTYDFAGDSLAVQGDLAHTFDDVENVLSATSDKNGEWVIDFDAGTFTYQADPAATGSDSLSFTLTDRDGDGSTSSVDIALQSEAPQVQPQQFAVEQEEQDAGDPPLLATAGDDVFAWELSETGEPGGPREDTILEFGAEGTDVLDLSDLLTDATPGEGGDIGNLDHFLNVSSDGTDTVVRVSTSGGFTDGNFDAAAVDQTIMLAGLDLGNDSAQAIRDLLSSGQLLAD